MQAELQNHFVQQYMDARWVKPIHFRPGEPISIGEQREGDKHQYCCRLKVTASAITEGEIQLVITNSPMTATLRELIEDRGEVQWDIDAGHADAALTLSIRDVSRLRQLAKTYRRTVGRGARYSNCNWKWICPRTADALDSLAACLMAFRRVRRTG